MKLPNAHRAIVEDKKVRDYLLSIAHPVGRFKAAFFGRAGFEMENWSDLADQFRGLALHNDAELGESTHYGQKYLVSGTLIGPRGFRAKVVVVWVLRTGESAPRLVTAYPE